MIVLLGGEKGGSGKSCLAQNLAVWLQRQGRDVLILDADPQKTTSEWVSERNKTGDLPPFSATAHSGDLRVYLADAKKRYQDIVVDAGGADSESMRSAMLVATHMLIPFRPKRRDLKTLPSVEDMVRNAKMLNPGLIARAVITQAPALPSQGQRILDSKETCDSFGIRSLQAFTTARNVYDDAEENGSSVLEAGTDSKAIEEIELIARELFAECM